MDKKFFLAASVALTALVAVPAWAEDAKSVDTSIAVMQFDKATWVKTVASSNMFEIESSRLALEKASSPEVKELAQQMIDDHTKAGEKLKGVLKSDPPKELAPKHADALALLKKAEGADFDAAYMSIQHGAHMEAVTVFRTYAAKPDDPALGAFAKETLPTLEMHLEHVKMMAEKD